MRWRSDSRSLYVVAALAASACTRDEKVDPSTTEASTAARASARVTPDPPPELLYLPDGGDIGPPRAPGQELLKGPWGFRSVRCPSEMVDIKGLFCIDRYEATLVDRAKRRRLSPYYHPTRGATLQSYATWQKKRLECGSAEARLMPVPPPAPFQLEQDFEPVVEVRAGVIPNGYLSGTIAEQACRNAGKRLCRLDEWFLACKGEEGRKFPYGERYEPARCNVFREAHPARILHQDASIHHLDPRLNLVQHLGEPLLRATGMTADCRSNWGTDSLYDMVGNLDEWIEDPEGTFVGGFYARGTREGCDARISAHAFSYFDYSLGVRCCK